MYNKVSQLLLELLEKLRAKRAEEERGERVDSADMAGAPPLTLFSSSLDGCWAGHSTPRPCSGDGLGMTCTGTKKERRVSLSSTVLGEEGLVRHTMDVVNCLVSSFSVVLENVVVGCSNCLCQFLGNRQ